MIRAADTLILKANAEYLTRNPDIRLLVVGYCDPIGTDEYNLQLGLRRADAVRTWMIAHGIPSNRIETKSFGKERAKSDDPVVFWRERRCEIWVR